MIWDNGERVGPIRCQPWWQFLIYTTHSAGPPFWLSVTMTLFCELSVSGLKILWMTSWRHVFRKNNNYADHQCKLRLYLHNSIHHPHILSYIDMWNCFPYSYNQHYHHSRQCRIHIHQHLKVELQPHKCRVVHKTADWLKSKCDIIGNNLLIHILFDELFVEMNDFTKLKCTDWIGTGWQCYFAVIKSFLRIDRSTTWHF